MTIRFPEQTPTAVRRAILAYLRRRRLLALGAVCGLGWGLTGLVVLACLLADRFIEIAPAWRQLGPVALAVGLLITVVVAVWRFARREPALATAIRLDQALPESQDRWGTCLDLAARQAHGESVGAAELVARLYADAEAPGPAAATAAARLVTPRWFRVGAAVFLVAAAGFVLLGHSSRFDLDLLVRRFLSPQANLPRDSMTRIHVVSINGQPPFLDALLPGGPDELFRVPEGEPAALVIALGRRGPVPSRPEPPPTPRLEFLAADGRVTAAEFLPTGPAWTFTQPEVATDLRFRIRAGDALTQVFRLTVVPRIKIRELKHTIRYPGYTKLPPVLNQPLASERLGLFTDSQLDFVVECDRPLRELTVEFELFAPGETAAGPVASVKDQWQAGRTHERPATGAPVAEKRRRLPVKIRPNTTGSFRLRVDQSGILRIHPVGENGLPGRDRVCVIEAVRDNPPRLTITGVEADTYIVPGELVGYSYTAEDDLAITDLYMEWECAGAAHTGELFGQDYIRSPDFGKPLVTGHELIQRMNYFVYATEPYAFTLVTVDSKGQETRSATYRIHLLSDSYAARFAAGIDFLDGLANNARQYRNGLQQLGNQLNILSATAGDRKAWPADQPKPLEEFVDAVRRVNPGGSSSVRHYYSGWPARLQRTVGLLLAVRGCLEGAEVFAPLAEDLGRTQDLPAAVARLRARFEPQQQFAQFLENAAGGERRRFVGEVLLQRARELRQRLGQLTAAASDSGSEPANVQVYREKTAQLLETTRTLDGPLKERLAPALAALQAALADPTTAPLLAALEQLQAALRDYAPPPSAELAAALDEAARRAAANPVVADRLQVGVVETVCGRDSEGESAPVEDLDLVLGALRAPIALGTPWYRQAPGVLDLWLMGERLATRAEGYRRDQQLRRHVLNAAEADDQLAILREQALLWLDLLERSGDVAGDVAGPLREAALAVVRNGLASPEGDRVAARVRDVVRRLAGPGRTELRARQASFGKDCALVFAALATIADTYEAYAAVMPAEPADSGFDYDPIEPGALQAPPPSVPRHLYALGLRTSLKATELAYRQMLLLRLTEGLGAPPGAWEQWLPWHQLALLLALDRERGLEMLTNRQLRRKVTPETRRLFATRLREHAAAGRRVLAGEPLGLDLGPLMQESRTQAHCTTLAQDFALVSPFLGGPTPERAAKLEELAKAPAGRIIFGERRLLRLLADRRQLGGAAPVDTWRTRLQQLAADLAGPPEPRDVPGLGEALKELDAVPVEGRGLAPAPALATRLQTVAKAVDEELAALYPGVQLPPLDVVRRGNRRAQSSVARTNWGFAGVFEDYDRRAAGRLRQGTLEVLRGLPAAAPAEATPEARQALVLSYVGLVELRVRQIGLEQRQNQGISFLEEEAGPGLKLPPHIAKEFLRARNRRAPVQFKDVGERYFQRLYRDLAK